jgi:hypothetical protein
MTHNEIAELLGAYALDAVDADEAALVEDHLASCARCRSELADHREVAALLGHSGADAPPGVWDRIAGTLESAPPPIDLHTERRRRRRLPIVPAVVGVAAALLIAVLGVQVHDQDQRIDTLQTALADPMTPAFESALDDPHSRLFALTSDDGDIVLRGAVTEDGVAYLRASALPDLPESKTYQLWGAAGDQLVSLGVLGESPTVLSFRANPYRLFAITEEDGPGVVRSANRPVVSGTLT